LASPLKRLLASVLLLVAAATTTDRSAFLRWLALP